MKIIYGLLFLLFIPESLLAQDKTSEFASLNWLIGEWAGGTGSVQLSETWSKSEIGTLTGKGVTTVKGDTVVVEELQIHLMGNHLGYIASPNSAPPVFFTLIETQLNQWTFENKEHDFPQKIIYSKTGKDKFLARIEGINSKGEQASQEFSFKRVN